MRKMSSEYLQDLKWAREHHTELLKQYKDQWVAIVDKKIVASGTDLNAVEEDAKKKTKNSDIPVYFVECGDHIYGLYC